MVNALYIVIALVLNLSLCTSQPISKDESSVEPKFLGLAALYGGLLVAGVAHNEGYNSGGGHHRPGHGHGHGGPGHQQGGNFWGLGGCRRRC